MPFDAGQRFLPQDFNAVIRCVLGKELDIDVGVELHYVETHRNNGASPGIRELSVYR
jgi:hypothetical protein